ncbi:MAG: GDSL-type esterase/lipase family protein [Thermodesulfobacteriota bacterium]
MDVLLIGDSLIAWHDWQGALPGHRVAALGIPGETVGELLARLPAIRGRKSRADAVVVMIGTNNLAMGDLFFLPQWEELAAALRQAYPEAAIVFTSLLPVELAGIDGAAIIRLNRLLADAAGRCRCLFHDLHPDFLDAAGKGDPALFDGDRVHLSPKGYACWVHGLANLLAALPLR